VNVVVLEQPKKKNDNKENSRSFFMKLLIKLIFANI
jgi:hypothetical protein